MTKFWREGEETEGGRRKHSEGEGSVAAMAMNFGVKGKKDKVRKWESPIWTQESLNSRIIIKVTGSC